MKKLTLKGETYRYIDGAGWVPWHTKRQGVAGWTEAEGWMPDELLDALYEAVECLRWYADDGNWKDRPFNLPWPKMAPITDDCGNRARDRLKKIEEQSDE